MMTLSSEVINTLRGKTLCTAESLTGGGIGANLTAVPGASEVFKGGVISYANEVKHGVLCVSREILDHLGAVSGPTAEAMALGVRKLLDADIAVSVTGLAGPGGDEFGNPVGTVFIGYADGEKNFAQEHHFCGNREEIRNQTICAALRLILEQNA